MNDAVAVYNSKRKKSLKRKITLIVFHKSPP